MSQKFSRHNDEQKKGSPPAGGLSSDLPLRTERKPELYLRRSSESQALSERDFDEMVPEFMHRDFYRSQEDGVSAIDPSVELKILKPRKKRPQAVPVSPSLPLTPLRASETSPPEPPTPKSQPEPLTAVRQAPTNSAEDSSKSEPVRGPRRAEPSVLPRPVKTSSLNLPLVAALLFIVGLFLWREQTRPRLAVEEPLPLPKIVTVQDEAIPTAVAEVESPYPEMGPAVTTPRADTSDQASPSEVETFSELPAAMAEEEFDTDAQESSAQRAAILERMSQGTVSVSERGSRLEPPVRRAPSESEPSLFPGSQAEPAPRPAPVRQTVPALPAQPEVSLPKRPAQAADASLFPSEEGSRGGPQVQKPSLNKPAIVSPQVALPKTDKPVSVPGEPYQIAEPEF